MDTLSPPRAGGLPAPARAVRCRAITPADLDGLVALLCRGFPERGPDYWRRGLARHARRPLPDGCPRFGFVLEAEGRLVGAILSLFTAAAEDGAAGLRCNLSSWFVEEAYRPYATLLDHRAMKHPRATFTNVSAAPHTLPMHAARGFVRYVRGQFVAVPLLAPPVPGVRVRPARAPGALDRLSAAERRLVSDHLGYGCLAFVGEDERGAEPFVLVRHPVLRLKWKLGFSPVHYLQLVHCRSTAALPRFARALGLALLKRGHACVVLDADGPVPGLPGRYVDGWGVKLKRGPDPVRPGDLSYTEMVLFGP